MRQHGLTTCQYFLIKLKGFLETKIRVNYLVYCMHPFTKSLVQVFSKSLKMHQVMMQPMSSHLKKNLGDDNELGASQLVIIFSI